MIDAPNGLEINVKAGKALYMLLRPFYPCHTLLLYARNISENSPQITIKFGSSNQDAVG